jgi:septum formation protein
MADLVLASSSPYRKQLLERFGLPFECVAPKVDEDAVEKKETSPIAIARALAKAKAAAVADGRKSAVVIGSDQVVALGEEVFGKPGNAAAAQEQLQKLQGKEHLLITAVAVHHGKDVAEFVDVTTMRMRALDKKAIARYVERDEPLDCSGAYRIERCGIALFDKIQGEDHTAIMGLPLLKLAAVLRDHGFQVP